MTLFERVHLPSFAGATEWLNSEPLGPAELRGHVVLVNFWTWTCINWLRQEPYVRAWSQAYRDDGLIVIGVHTPEFAFEHDIDGVRRATEERAIDYPVAVDNDYEIWSAFANHYWPALYFADRRRRHPRPPLRRRTLREARARHPEAARRRPRARIRRRRRRGGGGRLGPPAHARDLPRLLAQRPVRVSAGRGVGSQSPLHAPGGPAPRPLGPCRRVDDQARVRRSRPGRREHRLPVPRARRPPRALSRSTGADPLPRAPSTARLPARRPAWTSTRTATAYSETTACTSSCASTTSSATERWRSPSSSQAPTRTPSPSDSAMPIPTRRTLMFPTRQAPARPTRGCFDHR